MIKWTMDMRREADVVSHHRQYQFPQSCHLASIHTILSHPRWTICRLHWLLCPLVNVIGHRLANLIIPGTLQVHSLWLGRPMPGSRGWEGACYMCMYILHPNIYPMIFFSIWPPLHLNISPKTIVCIHQALPPLRFRPPAPPFSTRSSILAPLRHLLKSQLSDPRSKFEHGI